MKRDRDTLFGIIETLAFRWFIFIFVWMLVIYTIQNRARLRLRLLDGGKDRDGVRWLGGPIDLLQSAESHLLVCIKRMLLLKFRC